MRLFTSLAAISALIAAPIFAHEFKVGDIMIDHPYSFVTPTTARAGAGYLTIVNGGTTADRLIAAEAGFERTEIHTVTVDADGIAKMSRLEDGIEIPAGETVTFAPGGLHIMFMGLGGDPFEEGEKVNVTLTFENAGSLDVVFNVEERNAKEPETDHSAH